MEREGSSSSLSCTRRTTLVSIYATILLLLQQTCTAKTPLCPPYSCGKIHNITHPFRLKGDPSHCGDKRYELECENNAAVLTLFSGKYHLQGINYNSYRIRLTDAGVVDNASCSSIPRYFLYDGSFGVVDGPDNFGSQPFTLEPFDPTRIAYFNCTNPVTNDPRYVKVDTSRCGSSVGSNNVYVVMEPSTHEYSVSVIEVGCSLMVATLASWTPAVVQMGKGNVSYGEIHRVMVGGFTVLFLPVVCEDRCGKGTNCSVLDASNGEVQCDKRYCHYAYHTTDKCGALQIVVGYIRAYLRGIIIGIGSRITFSTKQLDNPVGLQYFDEGTFIGRNIISSIVATRILLGIALLLGLLVYKWRRRHWSIYENIEHFLLDSNLNPIRYEYKEIKKMTGGFKVKLGKGGFGAVFKGKLRSGPDVAIKMLSQSNTNGQDFINEVATIGTIHHANVVRLVGYCAEGKKRALVYEFMRNGSLDKYIFSKEGNLALSYEKAYEISLGVARGIEYLHQGCDMQILHFDIKPHNILLDNDFIPKVSDFGLAKLYPADDSIVPLTAARGTLGYMAPELFYKNIGGVSYKADVYSFGMLLMEMTSRRRNSNPHTEHSSQFYFPFWIHDQITEEKDIEMEDASEDEKILAKKMFIVALWCIQLKPSDRPSMNKVVEMLEGGIESLELPSKPSFYPNETNFARDDDISSDQTSWSDSSNFYSCLSKTITDHDSLENDV